jgi:sensor domain CHASE-containing protein
LFKSTKVIASVLSFTFILTGVWYVDRAEHRGAIELDRQFLNDYTQRKAARLTAAINIRLRMTQVWDAIVRADPTFAVAQFDAIAAGLIGDIKGVISLQLAPNGIITHVTDVARNRAAIGVNLLLDKNNQRLAMRAIEERRNVIAGPLTLPQGGTAIIARLPVFTKPAAHAEESFWGFATVLIDVDVLLSESNVRAVDNSI